jgi:hypothetical protein
VLQDGRNGKNPFFEITRHAGKNNNKPCRTTGFRSNTNGETPFTKLTFGRMTLDKLLNCKT